MTRHGYIEGTSLLGFWGFFDGDYGDPATPKPYPRVTPSRIGTVLLPFRCPHCGAVRSELVDPRARRHYFDRRRKHFWCPACRKRMTIDIKGTPLVEPLEAGATVAPALVDRGNGEATQQLDGEQEGIALLGAG